MKIRVVSTCFNEAGMLPFYLRHYSAIADEIVIYDDASTDQSRAIISEWPKATVKDCPFKGLDDGLMIDLWAREIRDSAGACDWIMFPDIDEILYAPDLAKVLEDCKDYTVIRSVGANMTGDGLPQDDGRQVWEIWPWGVRAPVYAKPIIVKPGSIVEWSVGRHRIGGCSGSVTPWEMDTVKLLHYRYMGHAYTRARNDRNYNRVGPDKGAAWSNAPGYTGEHSPEWAEIVKSQSFDVIKCPHEILR